MKRARGLLPALCLALLIGCQESAPPTIPLVNRQTAEARRPSATPGQDQTAEVAPSDTAVATPNDQTPEPPTEVLPTATEEQDPPTPTQTEEPVPTAIIATPDPATASFSYCGGPFGEQAGERFSAELQSIRISRLAAIERLELVFQSLEGRPHGSANCLSTAASSVLTSTRGLAAVLRVSLPEWEHDERFASSRAVFSSTLDLSQTRVMRALVLREDPEASAGAVLELGLAQPVPFSAYVSANTIIIDVGLTAVPPYGDNPLLREQGAPELPDRPIYFIRDYDVWAKVWGDVERAAEPLSTTAALETAVAVSPDGSTLAFCRSLSPELPELGTLWVSRSDGGEARQLADVGGCADPAFSPDGGAIYFVAPAGLTPPLAFNLWTVALADAAPRQINPLDEWSRRHPQPRADGGVLTVATTDLGRSALLLNRPDGSFANLSGELLADERYRGVASALLTPNSRSIAVEALRADGGAELVLLDLAGRIQTTLGQETYWSRPLGWNADGSLFYLRARCQSGLLLLFELRHYSGVQDQILLQGASADAFGAASALPSGLIFVQQPETGAGLRGQRPEPATPATLWLIDRAGSRIKILTSQQPIVALAGLN